MRGRRRPFLTRAVAARAAVLTSAAVSACSSGAPHEVADPPAACTADPHLAHTAALLTTTPSQVRIALVGDSTRNESQPPMDALFQELRRQTQPGGGLAGVAPSGIASFGVSGMTVHDYLDDPSRLARIVAFRPTLIEISIGINDLRVDQAAGPRVTADLIAFAGTLHGAVPGADVLLTVPAALTTHDIGGHHYVVGADGTVNPPGAAQEVTTALRTAYLQAAHTLGYAGLDDVQRAVTGTKADPADPPRFLEDQLHPSARTNARIADTIVETVTGRCTTG